MRRRLVASIVALAVFAGGCSLPTTDDAVVVGPVDLLGPPHHRLPPLPVDEPVDEYAVDDMDAVVLVGPDGELVVEHRPPRLDRPADAVRALDTLLSPLSRTEIDRHLSTSVPPTTALIDYRRHDGGRVEVVLSADFDAPGTEADVHSRLAQVACTAARSSPATLIEITVRRRTVAAFDPNDCLPRLVGGLGTGDATPRHDDGPTVRPASPSLPTSRAD